MYLKIIALALLFIGEAITVASEMYAARYYEHQLAPASHIVGAMTLAFALGGAFLIGGYMVGYQAFRNIWVVTTISVTSILFVEPLIAWFLFQEWPTTGVVIGIVLGVLGFIATLVW